MYHVHTTILCIGLVLCLKPRWLILVCMQLASQGADCPHGCLVSAAMSQPTAGRRPLMNRALMNVIILQQQHLHACGADVAEFEGPPPSALASAVVASCSDSEGWTSICGSEGAPLPAVHPRPPQKPQVQPRLQVRTGKADCGASDAPSACNMKSLLVPAPSGWLGGYDDAPRAMQKKTGTVHQTAGAGMTSCSQAGLLAQLVH